MRRQIVHSEYGKLRLDQLIGRGSYGYIYKATSSKCIEQSSVFAVKVIASDSDPQTIPTIEKEIKILMSCQHSNIVKCYSVEVVDDSVWIIMEYCELGSLADLMQANKKAFTEQQIKNYLLGILKALAYLHQNHIIHRDIKAANVLLMKDGQVKVADFGVSTVLSQTMMGRNTRTGSPFWMSPELLSKSEYSFKTDIWSLGITAIELAEGVPPYSHQHPYRAIFSIQAHPPNSLTDKNNWSRQFNSFVCDCLTLNEQKRPTARELLEHPFLKTKKNTSNKQSNLSLSKSFYESQTNYTTKLGRPMRDSPSQLTYNSHDNSDPQPNYGTVVINDDAQQISLFGQAWTASHQEQENTKYYNNGTFKIKQNQVEGIAEEVVQAIRQQQKQTFRSIQSNAPADVVNKVQELYAQMECEITKIRNKYLKRIRELEQIGSPSFEKSLNDQKYLKNCRGSVRAKQNNKENKR